METISPLVSFIGGILSLVSPCTLPLIPVYVGSLSGPEIMQERASARRLAVFFHSLSFIIGFSLVFISLGAGAGLIGFAISSHLRLVRWIAGGLLIVFGLFMLASPRISWLNYEKRLSSTKSTATGHLRSFVIGLLFALAWTPCAGPVLAGILTLAFSTESAGYGSLLLGFYSLGVAVPFLIVGLVIDSMSTFLKHLRRFSAYIYIFSGLLLLAVGILILINKINWFTF